MKNSPLSTSESLVAVGTATLEIGVKVPLRNSGIELPVSKDIQDYYYNHTGDFMCGYLGSYFTNLYLSIGSEALYNWTDKNLKPDNPIRKFAENFYGNNNMINAISGLTAAAVIMAEETIGYVSVADTADIPMGLLGVATHMGIKYFSQKDSNKEDLDSVASNSA